MCKTKINLLALATISLLTAPFALTAEDKTLSPHSYEVRPEISYNKFNLAEGTLKTVLYGARFSYEYVRPNNVYVSSDVVGAFGRATTKYRRNNAAPLTWKSNPFVFAVETHVGYTYALPHASYIAPFVGVGNFLTFPDRSRLNECAYGLYGVMGFKLMRTHSSTLSYGLTASLMRPMYQRVRDQFGSCSCSGTIANRWGYTVSLPIKWLPEVLRGAGIEIEPAICSTDISRSSGGFSLNLKTVYRY